MDKIVAALETVLPVFLALFLGAWCRSSRFLNREGVDAMKKVVLNLTLPFVLLNAFATAEYSAAALILPGVVFLLCCLALFLGHLIVGRKTRILGFLASGFEAGMLGYALFTMLFPQVSISHFAILDLGQTLFVFTLFKILLSGKKDWKAIGKDMVATPILWAVAAGVFIGATGFYGKLTEWGVSGILDSATGFLSAPTAMIILLTVGFDLVLKEIPWKKTAALIAMRLGIMVVLTGIVILLNRTVLNGMIFEGAVILMFILPPPYVIPVFADEPDQRVQVSAALSAMTVVTMVLFAAFGALVNVV